jgi:hypothetical protein
MIPSSACLLWRSDQPGPAGERGDHTAAVLGFERPTRQVQDGKRALQTGRQLQQRASMLSSATEGERGS